MGLAGIFAILLRIIVAAALGNTLIASYVYAGVIAFVITAWCIHYRRSVKKNFDRYIGKFEMTSPI